MLRSTEHWQECGPICYDWARRPEFGTGIPSFLMYILGCSNGLFRRIVDLQQGKASLA